MGIASEDAIEQLAMLIDEVEEPLKKTFQNMHQGYPTEALMRFLKAREWNVRKAYKMLVDCLHWRIENQIDNILEKPIMPTDLYRTIRASQLVGLSGYSKEGLPVFAVGVGFSILSKVPPNATKKYGRQISNCLKVLDMTALKLSSLNQIKLATALATVDDLNYPEKTRTYYIVNAPYIFSTCWKVVKPLLHERTRRKVLVLKGCGRDELLKVMDYASLPHFCRRESSQPSQNSPNEADDCFSLDHSFHQQMYNYIKQQAVASAYNSPMQASLALCNT
ncbi:uncharacterized protein [Typha latifolia]|uniref:uncharacterized protein isoform X2 n=1 Tax=Typha latifolia TaxID=4733 RepID=UPI003C2CF344